MQVSGTPRPIVPPRSKPAPAEAGPELSVAPSRAYRPVIEDKTGVRVAMDLKDLVRAPGTPLGVLDNKGRLNDYRGADEASVTRGVQIVGSTAKVSEVPAPGGSEAAWDPYAYMPRFVFHPEEDAYPVDPAFDGDSNLENNAPATPNGARLNYRDGVIGGRQALNGGFAVSEKGDYTVLTYSFYYPHNKAGHYHTKDWSIAQVYLRPDQEGKLQPAYLYTSWHHGGMLTEWDKLQKDKQGRPVVQVGLGSHALVPVGKGQSLPKDGLQLRGDGQAELGGKALPQRLSFDAFQENVAGARILAPENPAYATRLKTMRYGSVGFDPLLPESFETHGGLDQAVKDQIEPKLDSAQDRVAQQVSAWGSKAKQLWSGLFD